MEIDKVIKALGSDTVEEMNTMFEDDLKKTVVEANTAMKTVEEELKKNAEYQGLKEDLKALTAGKREVDKRQKARIAYSLHRLEEMGKMAPMERRVWERTRLEILKKAAEKAASEITKEIKASGITVTASVIGARE